MKLSVLHLGALLTIIWAHSLFDEQLQAQGLIGSHFGIPGLPGSFDYIIAGGGTAGLSIARRLAGNSSLSIAVVEAGDFYEFSNGNLSEIPADASMFIGSNPVEKNPRLDWYQYTTRQPVSGIENFVRWRLLTLGLQGLADRELLFPSGKVLGGSSARNFMWYHRSVYPGLSITSSY